MCADLPHHLYISSRLFVRLGMNLIHLWSPGALGAAGAIDVRSIHPCNLGALNPISFFKSCVILLAIARERK
jgi:hypothetical protein